jgi:hypothetical protein
MVRVSKRQKLQKKALDNEEANIATNQHDEDPDSQDSNNSSQKPTTVYNGKLNHDKIIC